MSTRDQRDTRTHPLTAPDFAALVARLRAGTATPADLDAAADAIERTSLQRGIQAGLAAAADMAERHAEDAQAAGDHVAASAYMVIRNALTATAADQGYIAPLAALVARWAAQ